MDFKCQYPETTPETLSSCSSNLVHLMTGIRKYHDTFVEFFEKACKGQLNLGTRSRSVRCWRNFAEDFNLEINVSIIAAAEQENGQEQVNFTAEECRQYAACLERATKNQYAGPDQGKLHELFSFKMLPLKPSRSKSSTRSTAATGRRFTQMEVKEMPLQDKRNSVLSILSSSGLRLTNILKIIDYIHDNEDLIDLILMFDPEERKRYILELLEMI